MITAKEREMIHSHPLLKSRADFMAMARDVCAEIGYELADVFQKERGTADIVAARDAIISIARGRGYSIPKIAKLIGRDTSTVQHSLRKTKCGWNVDRSPIPANPEKIVLQSLELVPELERGEPMLQASSAPNRNLIERGSRNG